ncbi:MAG: GspH/FimT family pseudopilin [Opitutaceae bacterium]|nr:GspH/FimT family pseudopilin [Opitutaceae bacterium]
MTSSTARLPAGKRTSRERAGFTLIELILVMALLAIAASLAAPQMASFFRGRTLDQEARRLLSLTHYAQSRAVTEGYPMLLWIDPASGQYGLEIQSGYVSEDDRSVQYEVDPTISMETVASTAPAPYEDEELATDTTQEGILFRPDGLVDSSSLSQVILRQADQSAIALQLARNGLGFELTRPEESASRQGQGGVIR